jgi:hypothetical protein
MIRPMARPTQTKSLDERRKETLSELESLLGTRAIGAEEYRRRAEVARHATDETELESVRPVPEEAAPAPRPPAQPSRPPSRALRAPDETGFVFALMGNSVRKGPWEPPEILYSFSLMGGVELDFREAALLEGTTEVVILTVMGGAKIVVPDDVDVEVNGLGLMGGFEHVSQHLPGVNRPLIRIRGVALMGGVSVKVKPVGQTTAQRIAKRVRDWV